MASRDFYDDDVHATLLRRVRELTPETAPGWGRMNSAQVCAHCNEVLEVAEGKALVGTPWFVQVFGRLIKRLVLSDKPFPRGTRTHPQYRIPKTVHFEEERDRLLATIERVHAAGPAPAKHPLFGRMTADEVGWGMYKHLDHHLTQFGV